MKEYSGLWCQFILGIFEYARKLTAYLANPFGDSDAIFKQLPTGLVNQCGTLLYLPLTYTVKQLDILLRNGLG